MDEHLGSAVSSGKDIALNKHPDLILWELTIVTQPDIFSIQNSMTSVTFLHFLKKMYNKLRKWSGRLGSLQTSFQGCKDIPAALYLQCDHKSCCQRSIWLRVEHWICEAHQNAFGSFLVFAVWGTFRFTNSGNCSFLANIPNSMLLGLSLNNWLGYPNINWYLDAKTEAEAKTENETGLL